MSEVFPEIGENDVAKLFRGIAFRRNLRQAAAFTKQTGYESGFRVARDFYRGFYYVRRVVEGTTDRSNTEEQLLEQLFEKKFDNFEFDGQNVFSGCCYRFFDLHFHPETTKYPIPSYYDLLTSQSSIENHKTHEQIEVCPIMAVSHILGDDTIITLLYQKKCRGNMGQRIALEELDSDLDKIAVTNPSEAVDYLEESGLFHADMITLQKRCGYSPDKKDYPKLRRFVHTPRRRAIVDDSVHQPVYMELYSDGT